MKKLLVSGVLFTLLVAASNYVFSAGLIKTGLTNINLASLLAGIITIVLMCIISAITKDKIVMTIILMVVASLGTFVLLNTGLFVARTANGFLGSIIIVSFVIYAWFVGLFLFVKAGKLISQFAEQISLNSMPLWIVSLSFGIISTLAICAVHVHFV